MPYFRNQALDDQNQENNNQSQVKLAGGDQASPQAAGDQLGQGGAHKTGSNFTNLDKYLKANSGAAAFGKDFQDRLTSGINDDKDAISGAINGVAGDVLGVPASPPGSLTKIDPVKNPDNEKGSGDGTYTHPTQNYPTEQPMPSQDTLDQIKNKNIQQEPIEPKYVAEPVTKFPNQPRSASLIDSYNASNGLPSKSEIDEIIANPTGATALKYKDILGKGYTGPNGIQDNADAAGKIAKALADARERSTNSGTEPGMFALLKEMYGKPSYSHGEQALDAFLIGQGGGFDQSQVQQQATDLQAYDNTYEGKLADAIKARKAAYDQTSSYAKEAIGSAVNNLSAKNNTAYEIATSKWNELKKDLENGTISPEEYEALGINKDSSLYGADLSKYLKGAPTRSSLMSKDDYAKYQALNQLGGMSPSLSFNPDELGSYDASGAGFGGSYDTSGLAGAINQGKTDYTNELNSDQTNLNSSKQTMDALQAQIKAMGDAAKSQQTESPIVNQSMNKPINEKIAQLTQEQQKYTGIQSAIDELNKKYGVNPKANFKSINGMLGKKER